IAVGHIDAAVTEKCGKQENWLRNIPSQFFCDKNTSHCIWLNQNSAQAQSAAAKGCQGSKATAFAKAN
ncbi:MAG: hypothetical protein MJY77_08980, partial [Bacteroidaceae bacterium]|nr:hypothetical protein [Bacteroidaceae bacterium]